MENFNIDLPILFSKLRKHIQKRQTEILAPHGLSSLHAMYIITLLKNKDGLTQNELTQLLQVNKANTSRAINDMIKKNYAIKDSGNNSKIILTNEGYILGEIIREESCAMRKQILSVVDNEEREVLINILQKMIEYNFDQNENTH